MRREDSTDRDRRQRRRPIYGGLLILGLLGAAVLVFFLEDIITAFERHYEVVALVPDAPGIGRRTPVWVSGRRVGEVTTVAILPTSLDTLGRVAVTMRLPRHVQQQVRKDSRIRITSVNLMSEAAIDIIPGSPQTAVAAEGDTLRLEARPTTDQLLARAQFVRGELDTVMTALRGLAPAARARMEDTRRAIAAMDATMAEVQRMRSDLQRNEGLAALRQPEFRATMERARARAAELPVVMQQFRERTAGIGEVQAAVAQLQLRADTLRAQLDAAATLLDQPAGSAARFRQDPALLNAIDAARASLDSLIVEARRNPLRFVF